MSTNKVRVHATEGGAVVPMFALEDELQGKKISEAYAADAPVQIWIPNRGEQVYALIANGETIAIGDKLESAGDGTLQKMVSDSSGELGFGLNLVAIAVEACTVASSGLYDDDDPRCIVMIA